MWGQFIKKTRGQKSRASVPLKGLLLPNIFNMSLDLKIKSVLLA
jgi:hypothetical protein